MKHIALFLLFGFTLFGQSFSLTGPLLAPAGSSVTVTIGLVSGGGPAGVQWDMSGIPSGATVLSVVAGKTANCTATRCILSGVNVTAIPDGPIATIKYTQPSANVTTTLAAALGASASGQLVALSIPPALTVPLQSNCDLNGDGKVDATDEGLMVQQALGALNGTPTILDVIRVVIAANGGACLR